MFDLSMQSALDIFCYVLVLIYGLALSADLSTGGYVSRQQKYLLTLLCLLFLLMQGLGLVLLGERAVKQLYPLVTHVPLVLILILFMKKSVGVAIVSTCTAYLCCQPPRWGRIAVEALTEPRRVTAKIRHSRQDCPATVEPLEGGRARILFDKAQRACAPGQSAVFYEGDAVLGGGFLE